MKLTIVLTLAVGSLSLAQAAVDPNSADQAFVDQAGALGVTEIEASRLALKQSSDSKVQEFARQMIADHSKLADQLRATAKQEGATTPTSAPDAGIMQKLMTLNGAAFDLRYIQDVALQGHQKSVDLFSQESDRGQNTALKQLAQTALPVIRHHQEMAQKLASDKKISSQ